MPAPLKKLALVLAGGGARAAYQVGFLRSLARAFPDLQFPVITGVSAGAINAAFLANSTDDFPRTVERLTSLWTNLTIDQVFRTDFATVGTNMLRWALRLTLGGAPLAPRTHGLVNTDPLRDYLRNAYGTTQGMLTGVETNLRNGRLKAVGITTTSYTTGETNTWVQGEDLKMWERPGRRSRPTRLSVEHVMASSALPLIFPAVEVDGSWHGDGGMGLIAPLSPALHLGADLIMAVSTRFPRPRIEPDRSVPASYPPPASVVGVLFDTVFLDTLDHDALTVRRVNQFLARQPAGIEEGVRPVELLLQRPTQNLEHLAHEFETELPRAFRFATRGLGTRETSRAGLLATLMFAPGYIRRMIEMGERDGDQRRAEIATFLGLSL